MPPRIHAPELPAAAPWLNTDRPLRLQDLRGRVVLLDFWTYGCINCLHVLPDLKYLEQKYAESLTVIGIHSAKFDHEKEQNSIRQAILRYDIQHPVVVDSGFQVWDHYTIRAWPTIVVIDPEGYIVGQVSGEGHRDSLEQTIGAIVHNHQTAGTLRSQKLDYSLEKHAIDPALEQRRSVPRRLSFPGKVLADVPSNQLFIADSGHHRIIVTTLTGHLLQVIGTGTAGWRDGGWAEAQFAFPQGMAFDRTHQRLYVADTDNHAIRQIDWRRQTVTTIAGTGQQSRQVSPHGGDARATALNSPWDLVVLDTILLIAMAGSHQIWALDLEDGAIGTYAGTGAEACVDGTLDEATFAQPSGLATDGETLWIADSEGSTIRAIDLDAQQVRTVCGSGDLFGFGDRDGPGETARLQHCLGVALGEGTSVWVADTYNHKLKRVDRQTGECQTVFGDGIAGQWDGRGLTTRFSEPAGLSQGDRYLYVADTNNHAIRRVDLDTQAVTTLSIPDLCAPTLCFPS